MMARGRKEDLIACAGTSEGMRSVGFGIYEMTIPGSVTSIGRDSFTFCDDLTIFAPAGSYAEKYAKEDLQAVCSAYPSFTCIETMQTARLILRNFL